MSLFSSKNKSKKEETKKETKATPAASLPPRPASPPRSLPRQRDVLLAPRITEKATFLSEKTNTYVFNVHPGATAGEVRETINAAYKIWPVAVRTLKVPRKKVFVRGKKGMTRGGKKAYVTLKKGDNLTLS